MTEIEQLKWSSFMPALLACIGATKGPVLELGVGHFSTPALHALCGAMDRQLVSVEKDADWFNAIATKFSPRYPWKHAIERQRADDPKSKWTYADWSVVFIDDSPGGQNRREWFELMLPRSEYVVVHDYEKDNEESIAPLLSLEVKFKHVTRTYQPPTLVASMTHPIPQSILFL